MAARRSCSKALPLLCLSVLALAAPAPGEAQKEGPAAAKAPAAGPAAQKLMPAGKKAREAQAAVDPADALAPQLRAGPEPAAEAAQKLAALNTPRALEVLLDELALGLAPKSAAPLLSAVAAKKSAQAFDVLSLYARDRNPELRRISVEGLGEIAGPRVVPVLIAALSDPVTEVRAAAAQALGKRREKSAEPQLLKLLAHKDSAAPEALGQIGGPETARGLSEMVGNVPDRLVVQTLGELLKRKDFGPDPLRLEVVKTLGKIPGSDALDVLSDYVKASPKDKAPSRVEAGKIVEQRTAK